MPAPQLAVLGSPISHSLSPRIHRAAYEVLGLDWRYQALETEVEDLAPLLLESDPSWLGFSVTMPLKEEAHRLAARLDPVAETSGVVNTLARRPGETEWAGFNTDVFGLAGAIEASGLDATNTVVIGAGATAVSAVLAAQSLGAHRVDVVARRAEALSALVARFVDATRADGGGALSVTGTTFAQAEPWVATAGEPTLVISTLPGPAGVDAPVPAALFTVPLFDVAYDPWPSPLAERWRTAGGVAHAGHSMLVRQAIVQIRIFLTGDPHTRLPNEEAVLTAMTDAVTSANMGG